MKTHTTIWNADDHRYTLVRTDESIVLLVDDEVRLTGGAEVFEPLARALRRPSAAPGKAGKPWTEAEDTTLAQRHQAGEDVAALMETFQRSRGSIRARLVRLGLVDTPSWAGRWPAG